METCGKPGEVMEKTLGNELNYVKPHRKVIKKIDGKYGKP